MPEASTKPGRPAPPVITPADRFGLTLCLAIITHAAVVLGVSFSGEDTLARNYETLEIILVQQKSEKPDEAKLLAQANLDGGGDVADPVTPKAPLPAPFPAAEPELTTPPPSAPPAAAEPAPAEAVMAVDSGEDEAPAEHSAKTADRLAIEDPVQPNPERELPDASTLVANSLKMAALSAEIQRKLEARAERPRRKFISASTSEFLYAAYMEAWRAKVERIGNLNYPDAAREQKLSGSLILDVSLNPDGAINDIIIRRSSGHKILDDAAIRIVRLAGPYAPFPEEIRQETDILHITRTWQFINSGGFR